MSNYRRGSGVFKSPFEKGGNPVDFIKKKGKVIENVILYSLRNLTRKKMMNEDSIGGQ